DLLIAFLQHIHTETAHDLILLFLVPYGNTILFHHIGKVNQINPGGQKFIHAFFSSVTSLPQIHTDFIFLRLQALFHSLGKKRPALLCIRLLIIIIRPFQRDTFFFVLFTDLFFPCFLLLLKFCKVHMSYLLTYLNSCSAMERAASITLSIS